MKITVKGIVEEDFVNFHTPSMVIMSPRCDWKCGKGLCQNSPMALSPSMEVYVAGLVTRYLNNPLTGAVVFSGLEPMLDFEDILTFIVELRNKGCQDPVVIYTGYDEDEVEREVVYLQKHFKNIYMKFGRYENGQQAHYDDVLGISLASDNQYGKKIC